MVVAITVDIDIAAMGKSDWKHNMTILETIWPPSVLEPGGERVLLRRTRSIYLGIPTPMSPYTIRNQET
jgi:hypothetical protein